MKPAFYASLVYIDELRDNPKSYREPIRLRLWRDLMMDDDTASYPYFLSAEQQLKLKSPEEILGQVPV